jgi:NADPH:quinone reductase-like Zn-dependent oxidoreductase
MENERISAVRPKTMKDTMMAVQIHGYGGPEMLKYEEVRKPTPGWGEILVRVHAAGVNPIDWKVREGYMKQWSKYEFPLIPGWEFSGVVELIGRGDISRFHQGDEVYSKCDTSRNGAYAEYIIARESEVAFKPRSLNHIQTGGTPLAVLTAWQALFEAAYLDSGQSVLIHGAAGGVGHFAVQLAKWRGAYVIGTASKNNKEFLRDLGIDEFIDYTATNFEEATEEVDAVIDTIGGEVQRRSFKALKKGGILVSIISPPSQQMAEEAGVRQVFLRSHSSSSQLTEIAELIDEGKVKPIIEKVLPLQQAAEAQELNRAGHTHGKIVLQVV